MKLSGRTALISGAAGGIGRAAVEVFLAEGARVAATDLRLDSLREALSSLGAGREQLLLTAGDVASAADCARVLAETAAWAGRLDALANVAGIGQFNATVETIEEAEWDRVLAVNLKSIYLMSRAAIPHLRASGGGAILNVASPHAFATTAGVAAYAASKGGVVSLSRQMAIDLAVDRIRVVSVIPGAVDTPMLHAHAERQKTTLEALGWVKDPRRIGRIGEPVEIARAIAWLASDDASFVNGAPIFVDGGLLATL